MAIIHTPSQKTVPRGNQWYFGDVFTPEDVKARYIRLAKELHPDSNSDENAVHQFQALGAQYEIAQDAEMMAEQESCIVGESWPKICLTQLWAKPEDMIEFTLTKEEFDAFLSRVSKSHEIVISNAELTYYKMLE